MLGTELGVLKEQQVLNFWASAPGHTSSLSALPACLPSSPFFCQRTQNHLLNPGPDSAILLLSPSSISPNRETAEGLALTRCHSVCLLCLWPPLFPSPLYHPLCPLFPGQFSPSPSAPGSWVSTLSCISAYVFSSKITLSPTAMWLHPIVFQCLKSLRASTTNLCKGRCQLPPSYPMAPSPALFWKEICVLSPHCVVYSSFAYGLTFFINRWSAIIGFGCSMDPHRLLDV